MGFTWDLWDETNKLPLKKVGLKKGERLNFRDFLVSVPNSPQKPRSDFTGSFWSYWKFFGAAHNLGNQPMHLNGRALMVKNGSTTCGVFQPVEAPGRYLCNIMCPGKYLCMYVCVHDWIN